MPVIDWNNVPDPEDFSPIPDGQYLVQVEEVEEKTTQNGDEMWSLKHVVLEGPYKGRHVFDNITFSQKGMPRVKLILSRLGIATSGQFNLLPIHIVGKTAVVDVVIETYSNAEGQEKKRNTIPFSGYHNTYTPVTAVMAMPMGGISQQPSMGQSVHPQMIGQPIGQQSPMGPICPQQPASAMGQPSQQPMYPQPMTNAKPHHQLGTQKLPF